ncbi:glycosyltransferase family 2 protein [Paenibacillus antri]|uniref:Glycosyltransferase family 2 protein n=1 Tax=Paenibacillus antri TaxID=2582848 RepID=A0A5R9FZC1_9BACL|nr:glycosyltransferase family 2 protein [Paenibacillus antri]TLS49407.1 glycosyltransferase family 2 protein [Paenibacillus antri]
MQPYISVIVPVYNAEKFIRRCVDSLLSQSYRDFEVLLINDGSTDRSGPICDEYQERYENIRVFHTENRGVSAARNLGIEQCNGEYVQFVDSDDFVDENYILGMLEGISEGIDLVIGGIRQVEERGGRFLVTKEYRQPPGEYSKSELGEHFRDLLLNSYINYCYAKLFRKRILTDHGIRFDQDISLGEDTLFVLKTLDRTNAFAVKEEIYYNYVQHSNLTLTYRFRPDKFRVLNDLHFAIVDFCKVNRCYDQKTRTALDKRYMELILFCLDENFKRGFPQALQIKKQLGVLLGDEHIQKFVTQGNEIKQQYPLILIQAIRSKNPYFYFIVYYSLIVYRKVRSKKNEKAAVRR